MEHGTFTIQHLREIIAVMDEHYRTHPKGEEAERFYLWCMKRIPQQKYRPLKRECPMTKRDEAGKCTPLQGKRLMVLVGNIVNGKPKHQFKNYSFLKRLIKLSVK